MTKADVSLIDWLLKYVIVLRDDFGAICYKTLKYNIIGDKMNTLGLTHKDLAKALGVSETTIKSYRRKFPACIVVASKGKPLRFMPEAETVCRRIQALFALGMAVEDVRVRLAEEFAWIEPELAIPEDEKNSAIDIIPTEGKKALLDEAALLKKALRHAEGQSLSSVIQNTSEITHTPSETTTPIAKVAPIPPNSTPEKVCSQATSSITPQTNSDAPRTTPYTTLPPEVRTAISDMARTVVELTLQQKKLLSHVERLEARLNGALETLAHVSSPLNGQNVELAVSQSVCATTPIHEQIQVHNATSNNISDEQSSEQKTAEPEQTKTKNPLLKIFGLERHG